MNGHGSKLPRMAEAAIAALIQHSTIDEAAAACGIGASTLRRWLALPDFQARYRAARARLVETAINRLQRDSAAAADALIGVAKDADAPAAARVSAARAVLSMAVETVQLIDLVDRVEMLERRSGHEEGD